MGKRVLVVDDNPAMVNLLREALVKEGFIVSTAEDGKTGLELIKTAKPDVVVLDLIMPVMSGLQVLHALRRMPETKYLPVVILTGRDSHADDLNSWMAGADRFLTKPCRLEDIVLAVRQIITPTHRR